MTKHIKRTEAGSLPAQTEQRLFSRWLFPAAVLVLFVISSWLHFRSPGNIPSGFGIDESSIGYNAWCIAETGADEYGIKMPVFFRGLDNFHDPVMVYAAALLIKFCGLSNGIVRLPEGLFLMAASVLFGFLAFRYTRGKYLSLGGAFVFSLLPWVFPVSRTMFAGYTAMLFGICGGWFFLMRAMGRRSPLNAAISAFCWAFVMYSHNCGRPFTAFFLAVLFIMFRKLLQRRLNVLFTFICLFVFFMLPMCVAVLGNSSSLTSRFSSIAVWKDGASFPVLAGRIILRYVECFSPQFLFLTGDPELRHNTGTGVLYIFMLPLVVVGILTALRYFRYNPYYRILITGLLLFPVATILTEAHMHSTRTLNGAPFWCIAALLGFRYLLQRRSRCKLLLIICLLVFCWEIPSYYRYYFKEYPALVANSFDAALLDAIAYSFSRLGPGETLFISSLVLKHDVSRGFKPFYYIHLLYFGRVPPALYQKSGFPEKLVQLRRGIEFSGKGIYLRHNYLAVERDGELYNIPNPEFAPGPLLYRVRIEGDRFYELYRIGSP